MDADSLIREVKEATGETRRYFDFHEINVNKYNLFSQQLPIPNQLFKQLSEKLFKTNTGETVKVLGYLEPVRIKYLDKAIMKWEKFNPNFQNGFRTYSLFAEYSKLPTEVLVVSPVELSPVTDLPNTLTLMKKGRLNTGKEVFYLKDFEPDFLKVECTPLGFPVINLKDMQKSIIEMSSLSTIDKHLLNSILSPYIGSDCFKGHFINGMGSSYISKFRLTEDLRKINNVLNKSTFGMPLSHFGIINHLTGEIGEINKIREGLAGRSLINKFKTLSWNLPSMPDYENLKKSEFKYAIDGEIGIYEPRNLANNVDFQHSILFYNILDKPVKQDVFDKAMVETYEIILDYLGKDEKNLIFKIMDKDNISIQISRIISYFHPFAKDEEETIKYAHETTMHNIEDVLEKIHLDATSTERTFELEVDTEPKVRLAFYSSDRTKMGFIEKYMERTGYSEKRAQQVFQELQSKGLIFSGDNVHFFWTRENKLRLV